MGLLNRLITPALKWYVKKQSKKSLPNYNQSFELSGLKKKVEVIRDRWAIPHIHAENQEDLVFVQGFLHAQDRLWQMEMNRRIAKGRLCELYGPLALEADKVSRTLGFARLGKADAERYKGSQMGKLLQAYADGVNTFIEQHPKQLPVEFKLLRISPEPWTPEDSMAYGRFVSFRMSYGFMHEIERMRLINELGVEKALELFPEYRPEHPEVLPTGIETYKVLDGRLKAFQGPWLKPLGGSNNWSVAPQLMEGGSASLCNDPHLAINMPNIWYENHLICPDLEVTGVSLLGTPLVLIGHNRKIAWGATLSFVDVQDTYIEKFTGENCNQYHHDGRILKATHLEEKIKIKGKPDHIEKVVMTHRGPVISDLVGYKDKKISLQSAPLKDNEMMMGFYKLNLAENWNDFVEACSMIEAPSLNLNYADTSDNIGYYVTGKIPIRKRVAHDLPRPAWEGDYDWTGFIPFEDMPHAFNPSKGYLYTCNHKIVTEDYPYDLGEVFMNGYRAKRLEDLFKAQKSYTLEDFKKWQMDFYSIPGTQFRDLLKETLVDTNLALPTEIQGAVEEFVHWDGYLTAESIGGCIFQVLKQELIELIIGAELGHPYTTYFRGEGSNQPLLLDNEFWGHDSTTLLRMLKNPEQSAWIKTTTAETLIEGMKNSVAFLKKKLGADLKNWQWGNLHQMTLLHVLGVREPLDQVFNVTGIKLGGDTDTLCQIGFQPGQHYDGTLVAASYRQVIDMGNFAKSYSISPVGQSGNLLSPHRTDQLKTWQNGEFKPMVWTLEQQKEYGKYKCSFKPV
jgi:penicillin amidase